MCQFENKIATLTSGTEDLLETQKGLQSKLEDKQKQIEAHQSAITKN